MFYFFSIKISVMYAGASEWNNLDADIRNINELFTLKRIQTSWMLNTFLDYNSSVYQTVLKLHIDLLVLQCIYMYGNVWKEYQITFRGVGTS